MCLADSYLPHPLCSVMVSYHHFHESSSVKYLVSRTTSHFLSFLLVYQVFSTSKICYKLVVYLWSLIVLFKTIFGIILLIGYVCINFTMNASICWSGNDLTAFNPLRPTVSCFCLLVVSLCFCFCVESMCWLVQRCMTDVAQMSYY